MKLALVTRWTRSCGGCEDFVYQWTECRNWRVWWSKKHQLL